MKIVAFTLTMLVLLIAGLSLSCRPNVHNTNDNNVEDARTEVPMIGENPTIGVVSILIEQYWWQHGKIPNSLDAIRTDLLLYLKSKEGRPLTESYRWSIQELAGSTRKVTIWRVENNRKTDEWVLEVPKGNPKHFWQVRSKLNPKTGSKEFLVDDTNVAHALGEMLIEWHKTNGERVRTFEDMKSDFLYTDVLAAGGRRFRFEFLESRKSYRVYWPNGNQFIDYPLSGRFKDPEDDFPIELRPRRVS